MLSKEKNDPNNHSLYDSLPSNSVVLATVSTPTEVASLSPSLLNSCNVLFLSLGTDTTLLKECLVRLPNLIWINARSAGVEHIVCPELSSHPAALTNARGVFSSSLAEYCMGACLYFAKDFPRLARQKSSKEWTKYDVLELRKATIGIVGYGSIGRASGKLAKAFGMKVLAHRRNPGLSEGDDVPDETMSGKEGLKDLVRRSDCKAMGDDDEGRGFFFSRTPPSYVQHCTHYTANPLFWPCVQCTPASLLSLPSPFPPAQTSWSARLSPLKPIT